MSRRRFSLTGLFLFVAGCSLGLAFFVPLIREAAADAKGLYTVEALAFSADGSTVAALFGDGTVRVWRAGDQSLLATLNTNATSFPARLAIAPDGATAAVVAEMDATAVGGGEIAIWRV
ncbi:MAG TPA: WD40 repeat domain-containing protein, partial [Pirellulales bacterium]|nr:WD40 repeat domain-containing protein [Pirellulales bacterium]